MCSHTNPLSSDMVKCEYADECGNSRVSNIPTTHKHTAVISPPAAVRPDKPGDESVRCFPVHPMRVRKRYFMLSINTYTFFKNISGGESNGVLFQEAECIRVSSDSECSKLPAVTCRESVLPLASSSSCCVEGLIQQTLYERFSN